MQTMSTPLNATRGSRPLIGLTSRINPQPSPHTVVRKPYVDSVVRAGGMPVVLPAISGGDFSEWLAVLDGLMVTGGEDVNPLLFDEQPHRNLGRVDTVRDTYELALVRQWLATGKPLLAICRGIQLLQIAAGGTVIQDILAHNPQAYRHEQKAPRSDIAHEVEVAAGSTLAGLLELDGCVRVNSIHHQAVAGVAPGFRISARAGDGVVEAIEAVDGGMVVGVQWHPEEMDCPIQRRLFKNFVTHIRNAAADALTGANRVV